MFKRLLLACAFVSIAGANCMADGVIRDAIGAVATGRGGANIGFADTGQMIIDNPAAIVNMPSLRLREFAFDVLVTDLDYADADNPTTSGISNPFPMGQFAMAFKNENSDLGLGFGIFPQAGFSSEYLLNGPPPFSGPQHYKAIGALVRFLPAISYRATDRLSVGANLGVAVNHMELEGPYTLQGPNPFVGTPTKFDFQGTGASLSWAAGLQYIVSPATTIGVNYQSETSFGLDGNTFVEIPGLGTSRFDSVLDITWPQTLGFGVKHQLNYLTRVGLDLVWFDWSRAFDSFDMTLQDPDNPVFGAVIGNRLEEQFPLRWRDTLSVKLGMERDLANGSVVRAGYVYHRNPVPAETLTPFIQTTLEHAVSVGYGWRTQLGEIDVAYQYSFSGEKSVGTSGFVGGDFDNATHNTRAHWLSISSIRRF